jgi:hypothetical protein
MVRGGDIQHRQPIGHLVGELCRRSVPRGMSVNLADALVLRHTEDEGWPVRLDIPQGVEAYVQQTLAALERRNEHDQHPHHSRSH